MITFSNITKRFGSVLALDNLSFEIPANKVIGLIGANGAGKTTILRHIIRYLKPDFGTILLEGKDINSFSGESFPVAFIPDIPVYYEELTVEEHFLFISAMYGTKDKVDDLLSVLELTEHRRKVPGTLSKGTLQKMMIGCALLRDYELLIADEPFTGLDPKQIVVLKKLLTQEKAKGKTIVLSTHLLAMIEDLCDYYVFIDHGKLLGQGSLEALTFGEKGNSLENIYIMLAQNADEQDLENVHEDDEDDL